MTDSVSVQVAVACVMSLDDTRHLKEQKKFKEMHHALTPVMVCNNVGLTEKLFEEISEIGISVVDRERPKIENTSLFFIYRMPKE